MRLEEDTHKTENFVIQLESGDLIAGRSTNAYKNGELTVICYS